MTGSRPEEQASTHTATGIAPDSHRIPSSPPLRMGRHEVMVLFGGRNYIAPVLRCQYLLLQPCCSVLFFDENLPLEEGENRQKSSSQAGGRWL